MIPFKLGYPEDAFQARWWSEFQALPMFCPICGEVWRWDWINEESGYECDECGATITLYEGGECCVYAADPYAVCDSYLDDLDPTYEDLCCRQNNATIFDRSQLVFDY